MLINVVDVACDNNGNINMVSVTDGNDIMNVTPSQILTALLDGKMESNTVRINIYGIDILVNGTMVSVNIQMTSDQYKKVKSLLNIDVVKEKKPVKTQRQVEQESKLDKLAAERNAFLARQEQQLELNRQRAAESAQQGLIGLSDEERRRRRQEYFKNKGKSV